MTVEDLVEVLRGLPQSYPVAIEVFDWQNDELLGELLERVEVCGDEVLLR
jgi:hypothetical protein